MSIAPCATVRFGAVVFPHLRRCRSPYENRRGDYIEDGRTLRLNLGKRTVKTVSVSLDIAAISPSWASAISRAINRPRPRLPPAAESSSCPNSALQRVEYSAKRQWLDLCSPVMNGKYHFCWPAIKNNSHRRTELAVRERINDQIAKQLI